MWPFTGIFSDDVGLLKEITLEDDATLHDMASSGDARVTLPQVPHINPAVTHSQIEVAADGNAYLMRSTNPAIIYAISAGGETIRRIKVDPGGSEYRTMAMHVYKNRIAVFFDPETYDKIMKIIDLEGREIATYDEAKPAKKQQSVMLGIAFAC
jgi:hypothetical protein